MKPIILYVDDEPNNLTVFEAALCEDWEVKTFSQPAEALAQLDKVCPWVIVSDQRMPGMSGVQLLEIAKRIFPNTIRIIATGYSDENLVVDSVRKAQIFDYIRKPWDVEQLETSLKRAIDFFQTSEQSRLLTFELQEREKELKAQAEVLRLTAEKANHAFKAEALLRSELECWVPPLVLWALSDAGIKFPLKKNLVGITFDIMNSSTLHGIFYQDTAIRSRVLQFYSEALIRHGGWRESTAGDSAFGHFGLTQDGPPPVESALAAAREFRVALQGFSETSGIKVDCGIGLHFAADCIIDVHTTQLITYKGPVTQKAFETISPEIDLLHRIEKLVHELPGSNIIMTSTFLNQLKVKPEGLIPIGVHQLKGQKNPPELFILKSPEATDSDIDKLKSNAIAPPIAA